MSTIQTQGTMVHLQSGLNISSGVQRNTQESAFTSGVVDVTTVGEMIALGDVIVPKQVFLKLVTGDPVKIGFDGAAYPLRLNAENESMILALDVESNAFERSRIVTVDDVGGSLGGTWFDMADLLGPVRVWMNIPTAINAEGRITYGAPVDDDVVIVAGNFFTKKAVLDAANNEYTTIAELSALIDDLDNVLASDDGVIISVAAADPGSSGNNISMSLGSSNVGTMEVDEALTGGFDQSVVPPVPEGGRLIPIPYVGDSLASAVASALQNFLDADGAFTATVAGDVVTVQDISPESRAPITDLNTGFTVSRDLLVTVIPQVHLLSIGSSQVAMAIAPI